MLMKFLSFFEKRFELIAFVLGFAVVMYLLVPIRYFIWMALPNTSEAAVRMTATNHIGDVVVETISDKLFVCNIYTTQKCWSEIQNNPLNLSTPLCLEDCPNNHILQMTRATSQVHNFSQLTTFYSLNDNGKIYVRQTGFPYIPGLIMGILIGGISAFFVTVCKFIFWLLFSNKDEK